jgi:hypothetical protein
MGQASGIKVAVEWVVTEQEKKEKQKPCQQWHAPPSSRRVLGKKKTHGVYRDHLCPASPVTIGGKMAAQPFEQSLKRLVLLQGPHYI